MDQEERDKKIEELAKKAGLEAATTLGKGLNGEKEEKSDLDHLSEELHKQASIPSLRTYQGDMAQFIKDKNESVMSIAAKERKRKDDVERKTERVAMKTSGPAMRFSMMYIVLGIVLLFGTAVTGIFLLSRNSGVDVKNVAQEDSIVPANKTVALSSIDKNSLNKKLGEINTNAGITKINFSSKTAASNLFLDFVSKLDIHPPEILMRNTTGGFMLGTTLNKTATTNETAYFVVVSVSDFGRGFSGMLEWEKTLPQDFDFLILNNASSTANQIGEWKDIIVSNKDTRGFFVNSKPVLGYAFLDKNNILIINNIYSIGSVQSAFVSKNTVR